MKPGAELEGGTEGHNTLFSPLNPSGTCHTLVMDGERKTLKKERGRTVRGIFGFFPVILTNKDQSSPRPFWKKI